MAESSLDWSKETYRLDEIEQLFSLPQLIQVTEGIYTQDEVDSFSAGDILKLDQCITIQKVVAQVVQKNKSVADDHLKEGFLIPLDYKGKLRITEESKRYSTVRELAEDFPVRAEVLQTLSVPTESGGTINVAAGTKIKLDSIKHGPDRLVIKIIHDEQRQLQIPLHFRCSFRAIQDDKEYSLKEAVDRYRLPQMVKFLENPAENRNRLGPLERIAEMVNIPGSVLRLERIIPQKVLIGHFSEPDIHRRTLVVIPLDLQEIGEIPVRVYTGHEDYPDIGRLILKNLNTALESSFNCSAFTRVSEDTVYALENKYGDEDKSKFPPVPPRRRRTKRKQEQSLSHTPDLVKEDEHRTKTTMEDESVYDDCFSLSFPTKNGALDPSQSHQAVAPPRPRRDKDMKERKQEDDETPNGSNSNIRKLGSPGSPYTPAFHIADLQWDQASLKQEKSKGEFVREKLSGLYKRLEHMLSVKTDAPSKTALPKENYKEDLMNTSEEVTEEETSAVYDMIDDSHFDYEEPVRDTEIKRPVAKVTPLGTASDERSVKTSSAEIKSKVIKQTKLTISCKEHSKIGGEKDFYSLDKKELHDLLINRGMIKFAKTCFRESLNGAFFHGMTDEGYEALNLSISEELKLRRIILYYGYR